MEELPLRDRMARMVCWIHSRAAECGYDSHDQEKLTKETAEVFDLCHQADNGSTRIPLWLNRVADGVLLDRANGLTFQDF